MATRARFEWQRGASPADLADGARDYARRLFAAMLDLGRYFAGRIESYAKRNARWTDRTTNARSGLTARALPIAAGVVIVLFHTVEYGPLLELANAGKYAIVLESLQQHHPGIMAALRRLVA